MLRTKADVYLKDFEAEYQPDSMKIKMSWQGITMSTFDLYYQESNWSLSINILLQQGRPEYCLRSHPDNLLYLSFTNL